MIGRVQMRGEQCQMSSEVECERPEVVADVGCAWTVDLGNSAGRSLGVVHLLLGHWSIPTRIAWGLAGLDLHLADVSHISLESTPRLEITQQTQKEMTQL